MSFPRNARSLQSFALFLCGAIAVQFGSVVGAAESKAPYQAPGTKRMAELLQKWDREFGEQNPYANFAAVKQLRSELATVTNMEQRASLQFQLATELLNVGKPDESVATVSNAFREMRLSGFRLGPSDRRQFRLLEGLANIRLGEVQNCVLHHNSESCLLPIAPSARHVDPRGAQAAEAIFLEMARQKTNDLGTRWLLNITAMTLGHYPDGVPADVRVPPTAFESEAPFPKFKEIAAAIGIQINEGSGGTVVEDFDGDGLLDIMLSNYQPLGQCHMFKNLGNGHFADVTAESGLIGVTGGLNIMQTDYNNDGWPDIYIVRGAWLGELGLQPDSLLRNNGDGTFADVTEEAGLLSFHPALSAVWLDANNDGWIDLFVGNETRPGGPPHPCQLFLNNGNGTFTECAEAAGVKVVTFVRGVTAGDYDNDGYPDIYISCLNDWNILLHNDGKTAAGSKPGVHFTDVTARTGVKEPRLSFPTWFWDYDNDGWLDIFVCGFGADASAYYTVNGSHVTVGGIAADKMGRPNTIEKPRLYHNERNGLFSDATHAARLDRALLAMSGNFGDLDNDGFLDFYLGTGAPSFGSLVPNEMFHNRDGKTFENVTSAGGFGHLQKGHAIAFADLNNDGSQDVVLNVGGGYLGDTYYDAVFANPGNTNHWLFLKLAGQKSNRAAFGARIKVVVPSATGPREIHRVVSSGGSFGSSPLRQEIGLGQAEKISRLEVWWPTTGQTNIYTGLEVNHSYLITEGEASAHPLALKSFSFPTSTPEHVHH